MFQFRSTTDIQASTITTSGVRYNHAAVGVGNAHVEGFNVSNHTVEVQAVPNQLVSFQLLSVHRLLLDRSYSTAALSPQAHLQLLI